MTMRVLAAVLVEHDADTGRYAACAEFEGTVFHTSPDWSTLDGCLNALGRVINEHRFAPRAEQKEKA